MKNGHHLERILDANFNRSREGLRVCEDICRFLARDAALAKQLKAVRHEVSGILTTLAPGKLLSARDTASDLLKGRNGLEENRTGWEDVYWANLERSKESLRVLEEILKLVDLSKSRRIKRLRFELYDLEKRSIRKIPALRYR